MGNRSKRDMRALKRAELQRKALELRKAGATYDQIANQIKVANRSVVWKLVKSAIAQVIREPAEDVLAIELSRLDAMLLGCWTKAKSGDTGAIDRALRIMERRASYLGLDAPKTVHFDMSKVSDDQLRQILAGDPGEAAGAGAGRTDPPPGEGGGDAVADGGSPPADE